MVRRAGALSDCFEVAFEHRGFEVLVGFEGDLGVHTLFVFVRHWKLRDRDSVDDPDQPAGRNIPGFSIRIHQPDFLDRLKKVLRPKTVWVEANRPGWFHLRETLPLNLGVDLPAGMVEPLEALAGQPQLQLLSIIMTPHVFRTSRRPLLWDEDTLDDFVGGSLRLFLAALELPPPQPECVAGLEFLGGFLEDRGTPRCGVCGEEMSDRLVCCAKCRTPHHRECWEYGGGCSVYACGATRFVER
ncbi:MAG: hypothetical protein HY815_03530 [Candidatus Riflebacteria bacterium]|nr:hypothetical protein [Candidatus Riflebacteria bacterium]